MVRILFILTIASISWQLASGQCSDHFMEVEPDSFILHEDIYFGENIAETGDLYTLRMDVYEPLFPAGPENGEQLRPLVIMMHGGSFTGGDKKDGEVRWLCEDFARRGIVAASINYRTESNPLSLISEQSMVKAVVRSVEDAKAGIRYFYKDAEGENTWNIDTDAIILGGSSAGSIAALHTVFMDEFTILKPKWKNWIRDLGIDTVELNGNSGNAGYPDDIIGLINISGAVANLDFLDNNTDIPIISIHNTGDLTIPYQFGFPYFIPTLPIVAGSRAIHTRMLENNANSTLVTYETVNHVPHTEFITGEQLFPEYYEVRDVLLEFVGNVVPCVQLPTSVQDNVVQVLKAYPNPASDIIELEGLDRDAVITFDLYDPAGRLAVSGLRPEGNLLRLPMSLPTNGMYYLLGTDRNKGKYYAMDLLIIR